MNHIEYEKKEKRETRIRLLSHVLVVVNIVIGFFCLWWFVSAARIVITFSNLYYLSKAWWQHVAVIIVAIVFIAITLIGQNLYEKEMVVKGRKLPISFIIISACELVFLIACMLIIRFY